ncbi:MAG TPA: hypothetical protein VGC22_12265 [Chitinophaga sp.]
MVFPEDERLQLNSAMLPARPREEAAVQVLQLVIYQIRLIAAMAALTVWQAYRRIKK